VRQIASKDEKGEEEVFGSETDGEMDHKEIE
jgi:hypothetical protein